MNGLMPRTPLHSLSIKGKMNGHGGDMGMFGDHFESSLLGKAKEDDYDSTRSGSDNLDGASGDDQEAAGDQDRRPRKKKYHRHTPHQIQELESFFKECPHPDEKQRLELSRRLGLENKQIKFWFQNRRTQMKAQLERHENVMLKQENDKLRAENDLLRQTMNDPICNNCGGPVVPAPVSIEQHQLRIENARLRDELNRITALSNKFCPGRTMGSLTSPISPFGSTTSLDLGVGKNGYASFSSMDPTFPSGLHFDDGLAMPLLRQMTGPGSNEVPNYDKSMFIELALAAMDEMIKAAQLDSPLWMKSLNGTKEDLNYEEYLRTFSPIIGAKPSSFVSEGTRESDIVIGSSSALVEALMDVNRCTEMFPTLLARAAVTDVIPNNLGGTKDSALLIIQAEFQVVSPFVPLRQARFLRFCKQHGEGVWAVVDVSIDSNVESSNGHALALTCRRLPSGCIVQDMSNGYSKVTWVEHTEYEERGIHPLYRSILSSGRGLGAERWLSSLQRYCEGMAILLSHPISSNEQSALNLSGKKSMLTLAHRMVSSFCSGVCGSSKWERIQVGGNANEDMRILVRKSMNDPGEPSGVVLSASTSIWLPVSRQRLFDLLKDERRRSDWDILSHGEIMQEMIHVPKGQSRANCVSLLRANALSSNDSSMLVLQETWNDRSGSLLVYAPVDPSYMSVVMNGGDSTYVPLLPCGFMILSDDSFNPPDDKDGDGNPIKSDADNGNDGSGGGSLVTVGFQILVSSQPMAKLNSESVETVNSLISLTIQRIKNSLQLTKTEPVGCPSFSD